MSLMRIGGTVHGVQLFVWRVASMLVNDGRGRLARIPRSVERPLEASGCRRILNLSLLYPPLSNNNASPSEEEDRRSGEEKTLLKIDLSLNMGHN